MLDSPVEFLLMAVLHQNLVQPVLQMLVFEAAFSELALMLRETAFFEGRRRRLGD